MDAISFVFGERTQSLRVRTVKVSIYYGGKGCFSENVHTPLTEGFLFCTSLPPGNSGLFSYIAPKNLAFKNPLSLGISNDLSWGGYGFFLGLHIVPFSPHGE